jgi:hypothetical protein
LQHGGRNPKESCVPKVEGITAEKLALVNYLSKKKVVKALRGTIGSRSASDLRFRTMHEVVSGRHRSGKTKDKIGCHCAELAGGDHVCWLGNWAMTVQQRAGHSLVLIFDK